MNPAVYVLKDTQVSMELRTKYTLQKLPDFNLYILVRQSSDTSFGHWSGLETKENMDVIIQDNFEPYRMSKKEILDYVQVEILKQGGRASDGSNCLIESSDGKRCGYSLCLTDAARERMKKGELRSGVVSQMTASQVEDSLRPEFHGHSNTFWLNVQLFHDGPEYWSYNNTLTEKGVAAYNTILENPDETI